MDLIQEADAGQSFLDALLKLAVRGGKGNIHGTSESTTTGEQGDDAATPIGDDRARVTLCRKGATCAVVGDNGELARPEVDTEVLIVTGQGLQCAYRPNGRA